MQTRTVRKARNDRIRGMHTKRLQRLFQMNKVGLLLAGLLVLPLLAGCTGTSGAADAADGKLLVYTSFYPMYDFARKMGGDKIQVVNMTPDGTEPHDWEPTATDISGLEKLRDSQRRAYEAQGRKEQEQVLEEFVSHKRVAADCRMA